MGMLKNILKRRLLILTLIFFFDNIPQAALYNILKDFNMSQPTLSRDLEFLFSKGLVEKHVNISSIRYSISDIAIGCIFENSLEALVWVNTYH